jgi:xanthine dehydrogenase YagS FAD-binding subunit
MHPFTYARADDLATATRAVSPAPSRAPTSAASQFIAGGTTMLDLMKLGVMTPRTLVDINGLSLDFGRIEMDEHGLHLGAFVHMAEAAEDARIQRDYPVIADSLKLAASQQLRLMATLAGNVLQRTRCSYFRDTRWVACNKRTPGSGCAAIEGNNRKHAVLGVNEQCIASYPGDFAQALIALGAMVETASAGGKRSIPFEQLHRGPEHPDIETILTPGEVITGFAVPAGPWTSHSAYVKVRDRQSYEFGLATAAVALDLDGDTVREARIGLGGVAYRPWRAREAEEALRGKRLDRKSAENAARLAFAGATPHADNRYKIDLGQHVLVRALLQVKAMPV